MKKILLIGLVLLLITSIVFAGTVTREIPVSVEPGDVFTVAILVTLEDGEGTYAIEDSYPQGFLASKISTNRGLSGLSNNKAKWVMLQGGETVVLTYNLIAPSVEGTYKFEGVYFIEDSSSKETIGGTNTLLVQKEILTYCGDGFCNNNESQISCPADCQKITDPLCGNGVCENNETIKNCYTDCGEKNNPVCGDKVCEAIEKSGAEYCQMDCDNTPPIKNEEKIDTLLIMMVIVSVVMSILAIILIIISMIHKPQKY